MAWGYEASFTIEHINNGNKRLRCYDCFYFNESDKSCDKTPRYIPDDGYDSWKYCGEFEIKSNVNFKEDKIRQYNNWLRNKPVKKFTSTTSQKRYSSELDKPEKPKIPNAYITNYATSNARIVKDKNSDGIPLLTREEREKNKLIECGFFKIIPRPREKKLVGIKLSDETLAQVIVYVSGDCIYYKKRKYPSEYAEALRNAIPRHE